MITKRGQSLGFSIPGGRWARPSLRLVLALIPLLFCGCRETDPQDAYDRDLGTNGMALLPTQSVFTDPNIAHGQADWHPFREPGDTPPAAAAVDVERTAAVHDERTAAQPNNQRIEAEIQELIDEYNEVVADGSVDDLLDYYVEEQLEAVEPLLEAITTLAELLAELRQELEAKMPDATGRIATVLEVLESTVKLELEVESVNVISDTEATVTMSAGPPGTAHRFVLVDEEWFIALPGAENLSQLKPAMDLALNMYRGWLDGLQAGRTSAEEVLEKLEIAAKMAETMTQP